MIPTDPAVDQAYEAQDSLDEAERLKTSLAERRYDAITKGAAVEVLSTEDLTREALPFEEFDQLCEAIARARIEAHRIYSAKLRGRYDEIAPRDPLFAGMVSAAMPALPGIPQGLSNRSIASLTEKYLDLKRPEWAPKTRLDNKTVLNLFGEVVGFSRPVDALGINDLRAFRDVLLRLPKNYTKRKANTGQSIHAIIKSGEKDTIQKPTITKYLTRTNAFLAWCAEEGYVAASLPRLKGPGVSSIEAREARYPFSEKQLRKLFSSPVYTGCKSASRRSAKGQHVIRDGKFWIPLIALYSGMRLGEIVQLLVGDIKSEHGVAYFDICRGEGEKKQIKTASSMRRVPIHKMLIELGLSEYVAAARASRPKERLFEDIKPGVSGDFSHNFSKWFGRYLCDIGAKTPKTAFHSFRHNFKDALVAVGVPESHARTLMGHADGGVHGLYGTVVPIKLLNTELQKIHYPLELSHLMAAGGPVLG